MTDKKISSISDLKIGDFVKFVGRDEQGRFSYTGQVKTINLGKPTKITMDHEKVTIDKGAAFEMLTFDGIMGFNMEDPNNEELYITTIKPKGWSKFISGTLEISKTPTEISVKDIKSKKELVKILVKNNPRKKEKSLLELAKEEIGGSDAQLLNYIKLALSKK